MITGRSTGSSSGCHLSRDGLELGGAHENVVAGSRTAKAPVHFELIVYYDYLDNVVDRDFVVALTFGFAIATIACAVSTYGNQIDCAVMLGLMLVENTSVWQ